MSVDGTWKLSMQTPIGERKSTLALQSSGGALTGKLTAEEGNATDIYEGKLDGDTAAWKADITNPMPLTLAFTATVNGDKISGTVSAGAIGSWPFSGTKLGRDFFGWAGGRGGIAITVGVPGWSRPDTSRQEPRILRALRA
jgi:hypothetical protein